MWNLAGAVIISGLVIVFVLLTILIGVVMLMGKILNKPDAKTDSPTPPAPPVAPKPILATPAAPTAPSAPPPPVVQSGISEQTVAVISAAMAAVMDEQAPGTPFAITGIQRSPRQARPVWGFAGMQQNTRPF